jgi:hypothetical protein
LISLVFVSVAGAGVAAELSAAVLAFTALALAQAMGCAKEAKTRPIKRQW